MAKKIGFAFGSWGDVIIHFGYIEQLRKEAGPIIYYGENPQIARFIGDQSFCTRVMHLRPSMHKTALNIRNVTSQYPELFQTLLKPFVDDFGFDAQDVLMSFPYGEGIQEIDYIPPISTMVRPSGFAQKWARSLDLPEGTVLVQPFSFNTNAAHHHWAHWSTLLPFIFERYPSTPFVLMGQKWKAEPYLHYPNVRSLIDACPSADAMYALSDLSQAVLTCSNSLAHYCASRKTPTLVCASFHTGTFGNIFSKVLRGDQMQYIGYTDGLYRALNEFELLMKKVR